MIICCPMCSATIDTEADAELALAAACADRDAACAELAAIKARRCWTCARLTCFENDCNMPYCRKHGPSGFAPPSVDWCRADWQVQQ